MVKMMKACSLTFLHLFRKWANGLQVGGWQLGEGYQQRVKSGLADLIRFPAQIWKLK